MSGRRLNINFSERVVTTMGKGWFKTIVSMGRASMPWPGLEEDKGRRGREKQSTRPMHAVERECLQTQQVGRRMGTKLGAQLW